MADTAEAARRGNPSAKSALLLVQYLVGCFLLFTRQLNLSAKSVERIGPIIALSVLFTVAVGTVEARDPALLQKINDRLSSPVGLLGIPTSALAWAAAVASSPSWLEQAAKATSVSPGSGVNDHPWPADLEPAGILRAESTELLSDPAAWMADTTEAARHGNLSAKNALLLVQCLVGYFLLFTRTLNPSAKAIERIAPIIALSVLFTVAVGTVEARDPALLQKINDRLSSPVGLLGLYLAVVGGGTHVVRNASKYKPSKPRRGASRPKRKVIRRYQRK